MGIELGQIKSGIGWGHVSYVLIHHLLISLIPVVCQTKVENRPKKTTKKANCHVEVRITTCKLSSEEFTVLLNRKYATGIAPLNLTNNVHEAG